MKVDRKYRNFARNLIEVSKENGFVSEARVAEVLRTLVEAKPRGLRQILEAYERGIIREIRFSTLSIEHAGELSTAAVNELKAGLEAEYGRPLALDMKPNPELIAGIRVRVGDDVIDHSVSGRLHLFQSHVR